MASVVPTHARPCYLPPLFSPSQTSSISPQSSRHPGSAKLTWLLLLVGKNRYLPFIFYPVDCGGWLGGP